MKVAILTDSNSGIREKEAKALGVHVLPMPFYIDGELYYEEISLSQEEFYRRLKEGATITTSMPAMGDVLEMWDHLLAWYDQVVYIPMSSGLSSSCEAALSASKADEYDGKVFVVNNQRISVTQKQSVTDALTLAQRGREGRQIRDYLERVKFDSSIYIALDTLQYLKKGGRITPAAAAIGTLLRIKPVLQIQGEKLDSFAKSRTIKHAKQTMLEAIDRDLSERFGLAGHPEQAVISGAYTCSVEEGMEWKDEIQKHYPDNEIIMDPLSLSVACHIGPGSLAVTVSKALDPNA